MPLDVDLKRASWSAVHVSFGKAEQVLLTNMAIFKA